MSTTKSHELPSLAIKSEKNLTSFETHVVQLRLEKYRKTAIFAFDGVIYFCDIPTASAADGSMPKRSNAVLLIDVCIVKHNTKKIKM